MSSMAHSLDRPGRPRPALLLSLILGLVAPAPGLAASGVVASSHPLATQAGLETLRSGGNAIDAAVAVGLTLGIVDGHNSGIGGGCFMVVRLQDGRLLALDGRETAPAGIRPEHYLKDGQADPTRSQLGALAPGIPGSLKVYDHITRRHGRIPLRTTLLRAARLAEDGFPIDATYASRLAASARDMARFPETRAIFLRDDGTAWPAGHILKQTDLARSYRALAEEGIGWFYAGPFAERTAQWMQANGGVIRAGDFADYKIRERIPLRTTYRNVTLIGFPPPSSGGVHVAQILNILESFDLQAMGMNSAEWVHVVSEAMKLAFADRAYWLGDPDFAPVPRGLVDKGYANTLAQRIHRDRASTVPSHGTPPKADTDLFEKHTTHFSVADDEGLWVACTTTLNLSFGSKVVVPGTGVLLNNQMDDFSLQPGVPNAFGLLGAEANSVQPGKRPLSSMSPTLVLQNDQPIMAVGAAGGPTIISQTLLAILHVVDFGQPLDAALRQPRFHHQWRPDALVLEKALADRIGADLARMGHRLEVRESFGACQAVARFPKDTIWSGMADPRGHGQAGTTP